MSEICKDAVGGAPRDTEKARLLDDRGVTILRASTFPADSLRLSVVVPNYNTGAFVGEAIRSILEQTMPDLEVIVVDDGSTDESVAKILALQDLRLTCVRQPNRGLAGARNTGILLARAPLIGFCDGDDLWYPAKAERQLAVMEQDAKIGLTFSYSEYWTEAGEPTGQLLVSRCSTPGARDLVHRNHVGNGSTPILRRECFEKAGAFDEGLFGGEDLEMWVRVAALTGLRIQLVPEVLTAYRIRSNSMSVTFDRFVESYSLAVDRFRRYVPGFTARDAARSQAEFLRIASRKAFSLGEVKASRALFAAAVKRSPALVFSDVRAFAMLVLHIASIPLPQAVQQSLYRLGIRLIRSLQGLLVLPVHDTSIHLVAESVANATAKGGRS
jgi:glycosyltransferase involved in cell wall biosynthesis